MLRVFPEEGDGDERVKGLDMAQFRAPKLVQDSALMSIRGPITDR